MFRLCRLWLVAVVLFSGETLHAAAQGVARVTAAGPVAAYGPYRANNNLLSYRLTVRVNPEAKSLSGSNVVRFKMLESGSRIQLDLTEQLSIDRVVFNGKAVQFLRDGDAFYVDTPTVMRKGRTYEVTVEYSGTPKEIGRFGGVLFRKDAAGRPWIATSCEDDGARIWWPNKDQWRDEPEKGMDIRIEVPDGLKDISNGRFKSVEKLGDGYSRWNWHVSYPINNYDVSMNIGAFEHFSDKLGKLTLDFYALPENLDKAKVQFAQAKPMLEIYNKAFDEYPFVRDGYKLIEAPYTGMEHQSAVTYGNHFANSYGPRDWTGVGISPRFDFIIIHESGHEWFGNSVSAARKSDMWIHEGFTTYAEDVYVEARWGHEDAIKYVNGLQVKVKNKFPIVDRDLPDNGPHDEDQYFKAALFLNTLRSVVDDDAKWRATLHGFAERFKYQNISTDNVIAFFNESLGKDYSVLFHEYLWHAKLPVLRLRFDAAAGTVQYKWDAEEVGFAMPVRVGDAARWTLIRPASEWQTMPGREADFKVARDLYYIDVLREPSAAPVS